MARRRDINLPRVVAIGLVLVAAGTFVASVFYPLPKPPAADDVAATAPARPTTAEQDTDDNDLADLGDVDLHKPLVDPPSTTRPDTAGEALLRLRLAGTILEPMHSYAIFATTDGRTELRSVGDRFNGVRLNAIDADSVTLDVNGRPVVLHAIKPAPAGRLPS